MAFSVVTLAVERLRPHPQHALVPQLTDDEYAALRDDIERRGIQVPLCVTETNVVLCGHHRLRAAKELGIAKVPVHVREGLSVASQVEHLVFDNVHRRQLSASQRAALLTMPKVADALRRALEEGARARRLAGNSKGGKGGAKSGAALPSTAGARTRDALGAVAGVSGRLIEYAAEAWRHAPERARAVVEGRSRETVTRIAQDVRVLARHAALQRKRPTAVAVPDAANIRNTVIVGDALDVLRALPADAIHCCVTSPPYWGLRDYEADGQIGIEESPDQYVAHLVEVFREVRRVLHPSGTLWLVLGDTYAADRPMQVPSTKGGGKHARAQGRSGPARVPEGLKPKDLIGIPWRVALALQADGWWLRTDIVWNKPNCVPDSVKDRPTRAHEYVFLLSKEADYFYDVDAIREPFAGKSNHDRTGGGYAPAGQVEHTGTRSSPVHPGGRNKRSVWTIPTKAFAGAHFAVFPPELPETCILAGTSPRGCCPSCGAPWERVVERGSLVAAGKPSGKLHKASYRDRYKTDAGHGAEGDAGGVYGRYERRHRGFGPSCDCAAGDPVPSLVLDPFAGSGTTLAVAKGLGRDYLGIELNAEYRKLIEGRVRDAGKPRASRARSSSG